MDQKAFFGTGSDGIYFLREQLAKTYMISCNPWSFKIASAAVLGGSKIACKHCALFFDSANRGGIDHLMKV